MICNICHTDLPESEFYVCKGVRQKCCKTCHKARTRRNNADLTREQRLERNAKARARRKPGSGTDYAAQKRYRSRNPTKAKARDNIKMRVYRGRMMKPSTCEVCGEAMSPEFAQAHHMDYERALYVVWCHRECHRAVHSGEAVIPGSSLEIAEAREIEQCVRRVPPTGWERLGLTPPV